MYVGKWFKTKDEAIAYQKTHGGALYKNEKYSRTKKDHLIAGMMFEFDPEEYKYSLHWTRRVVQ